MESVESPLDVLSRAATMVQDSLPMTNGNTSPDENSKQTSTKQLPTTKWKRERRRLPEYSRKSDPKLSENMPPELQQQHSPGSPVEGSGRTTCTTNGGGGGTDDQTATPKTNSKQDAPIDMSVRQRGLPPSYTQAISSPGYRPSVITQAPTPNSPTLPAAAADLRPGIRNDLPSGISMCDPIIDEHFRRSLGKDYLMLFNNNKTPSEAAATVVKSPVINNRVITTSTTSNTNTNINTNTNTKSNVTARELLGMDSAGLSVDDHFAKALGDTWLKLNQKESEIQQTNGTTEKSAVVSL